MNVWLNKALAAAGEAVEEPVARDISRTNSADSADSHLTALTTLSAPIEPLHKQAARTSPETTEALTATAPVAPQEWAAAAAQLQQTDRPATVSEERWQLVRADGARLLDWAPILDALEWTTQDVFGRDDLDRQSLAWKVRGQRIGPIGKVAAVLRGDDGSTTWVYRRGDK